MFDVSWSELLILGLVTLIFVGPKELPRFLGTLGRYAGVIRRQANEFRAVFEQAMREAEMEELQKEVRAVSEGVKSSLDEVTRSVEGVKTAVETDVKPVPAKALGNDSADPAPEEMAVAAEKPDDGAAGDADGEKTILKPTLKPTTAGPV